MGTLAYFSAYCLEWLAAAICSAGDPQRAARLYGAAEAQWRRSGAIRPPLDQQSHEEDLRALRAQLADDELAQAWSDACKADMHSAAGWAL